MKRFVPFLFILFCFACNSSVVFERYQEIPEETWSRYNVLEFKTTLADSGLYDIALCVRHSTDYEMANLWCFISTRSRAPKEMRDSVNMKIAAPDGRWLGQGYNIKTVEQPIGKNPVFLPQGEIVIRIEQGMRREQMNGIKNVGIKISTHGKE